MAKSITIEELLASNPQIEEEELKKARETLRKIRNSRIREGVRNLAPAIRHRRIFVGEGDNVDSRNIRLGRLRR